MMYLFDTNIFVTSKNTLPMDVWPTFWRRMVELINSGTIFSIDKVKSEIDRGSDELTDWIRDNAPKNFFLKQDADFVGKLKDTLNWAKECPVHFTDAALADYAKVADSYLVATAAAKNMVLVTNEKSNPQSKRRVMIPDACNAIGVRCCDLNTVFRELGICI